MVAFADMSPLWRSELVFGMATYYRHGAPLELVFAKRMAEAATYYRHGTPLELVLPGFFNPGRGDLFIETSYPKFPFKPLLRGVL